MTGSIEPYVCEQRKAEFLTLLPVHCSFVCDEEIANVYMERRELTEREGIRRI